MTKGAAIGYALLAAKRMGLIGDKLVQLERLMLKEMDVTTEGEAEEVYQTN